MDNIWQNCWFSWCKYGINIVKQKHQFSYEASRSGLAYMIFSSPFHSIHIQIYPIILLSILKDISFKLFTYTRTEKRQSNRTIKSKIKWLTHQMIKLSFHICVQKGLITLTAAPENIIFSPQIMCDLKHVRMRKMDNNSKN